MPRLRRIAQRPSRQRPKLVVCIIIGDIGCTIVQLLLLVAAEWRPVKGQWGTEVRRAEVVEPLAVEPLVVELSQPRLHRNQDVKFGINEGGRENRALFAYRSAWRLTWR
jgi:hypothetical protein